MFVCSLLALSVQLAPQPFVADIAVPKATLGDALRADIMRRQSELMLLGWLGRATLAVPFVVKAVLPSVFQLTAYDVQAAPCYSREGIVDCTLRESSVGGVKGIPFQLRLETTQAGSVVGAQLVGVGCDLTADALAAKEDEARMDQESVDALVTAVNSDESAKRLIVEAITREIFERLPQVAVAAKQGAELVACSEEPSDFIPKEELWALEGTSYKWVQQASIGHQNKSFLPLLTGRQCSQVSGYYFARSRLQDVRFASVDDVRFTFYLDPTEPFNSDDPRRIVNPEVINCVFGS